MNNKYIIFAAMYRYEGIFMENNPIDEKVVDALTTIGPYVKIPNAKSLVKKALNDNYGINCKKNLQQVVSEYINNSWTDGIIYHILYDIFKKNGNRLREVSSEQVKVILSDEEIMKGYVKPYEPAWDKYQAIDDLNLHLKDFYDMTMEYFNPENIASLESLETIFAENDFYIKHTGGFSMIGFNFSRVISMLADSCLCGYLTEEEAEKLLNFYGSLTEELFGNWQIFLSSCVFGKQLMSGATGDFIIDVRDYIKNCYNIAVHPRKLLEISGVWVNSDVNDFIKAFHDICFDEAREDVQKIKTIDFFEKTIVPVFKQHMADYLFTNTSNETRLYYVANTTEVQYGVNIFDAYVDVFKDDLQKDEIPFLVSDYSIFTNKGIHIHVKKLFRKKQKIFYSWKESLNLEWKVTTLFSILLIVNGYKTLPLNPNYSRIGKSQRELMNESRKEVEPIFKEDMNQVGNALKELQKVLTGKDI